MKKTETETFICVAPSVFLKHVHCTRNERQMNGDNGSKEDGEGGDQGGWVMRRGLSDGGVKKKIMAWLEG